MSNSVAIACPATDGAQIAIVSAARTGELSLMDGRVIRLAGIDWPDARQKLRRELAWHALSRLSEKSKTAILPAGRSDRWGRVAAQIHVHSADGPPEPAWLQGTLLALGLVRAWPEPEAMPCWQLLLQQEDKARKARIGLWSPFAGRGRVAYLRRANASLAGARITYEGRVRSVREGRNVIFINFSGKRQFTPFLMVSKRELGAYRKEGLDPATFSGKRLRVRGSLVRTPSLRLDLAGPFAVEVLE